MKKEKQEVNSKIAIISLTEIIENLFYKIERF